MTPEMQQQESAYDDHHVLENRLTQHWYPGRVLRMAPGAASMLELGLGHGFSCNAFARAFQRYIVIDGSATMIARFRASFSLPGLEIHQAWFEEFDTKERFDAIGMGFVLEHVADPQLILQRYARMLAPGGSIFIAVPNAQSLHRRIGHAAGMLPDLTQLSAADLAFGHRRYFTLESLRSLVRAAGLVELRTEGLLLKPVTTQQLLDLQLDERVLQGMLDVGVDYPELSNSILMQVGQP